MGRSIPTVEVASSWQGGRAELTDLPAQAPAIRLDTPAWTQWLAAPTTRSFAYPLFDRAAGWIAGFMTVRKERRARGSTYWVAYRRCDGQLRKIYLGRSSQVTGLRLAAVAAEFLQASGGVAPPAPTEGG
jgi:LuxR family transcriptional regulator, maltose regulon positive regulatory protein